MKNIELECAEYLLAQGVAPHLKGYRYLIDAIQVYSRSPDIHRTALYANVAQKHGSTASRVERCIRSALKQTPKQPASGEFIALTAVTLRIAAARAPKTL